MFPILALCVVFSPLAGCAYQFQGNRNSLKDLGVQKIYVTNFRNLSYRPGVEQLFTTAMVREIARSRAFEVVNSERDADAVLSGSVTLSESVPGAPKEFKVGDGRAYVAGEFSANVSCSVNLVNKEGRVIFASTVSDSKVHPGAGQIGDAGATAALINDSEHRLAVQFLATQMMASVYQRMIDTF